MGVFEKVRVVLRDLRPVLLVAIGVTVAGTVVGAVSDHVHKVSADEVSAQEVKAVVSGTNQTLSLGQWGLQFVTPYDAAQMPVLSYANESSSSVGLSSADLEKLGTECGAAQNALGDIVRQDAGTYGKTLAQPGSNVVATLGQYEFVYNFPKGACGESTQGSAIVNREESILLEALGSLGPVSK